jgi:GntR family transcriptional regulator, arabinose operon transcriptional repressor
MQQGKPDASVGSSDNSEIGPFTTQHFCGRSQVMNEGLLRLDLHGKNLRQPKHEGLKDHLVSQMLAGRLKPGQVLPSERHMMEELGVARMTVRQAMASLENDGLIRRVPGKGTFVDSDVRRKLKRGLDLLALVVPETREGFYPSLLHGFETAAADIHHQTIICSTNDDIGRQADIILQLMDKKVGGVALNPTDQQPTPPHQVRQLQEHGIPVVFCHRRVEGIAAPLLALPYRAIGRMAGQALAEHGHRRVAFLVTNTSPMARAYQDGLLEALQDKADDATVDTVYVEEHPIERRENTCVAVLKELFARPDRPTAIFASFDSLAEMIYMLLPQLGLRIPEDVSLIGEGGMWREGVITRRLTSVVVDEIATGRKAVELLDEMRRGERAIDDNTEIVMELSISDGETLAAPGDCDNVTE